MPDTKEQLLTLASAILRPDYVRIVKDPAGTPFSQNVTAEDLLKYGSWAVSVRTVAASGTVTLANTDPIYIDIDPNGENRDVNCPAKSNDNHSYIIQNTGTANILTVKRSGGAVICTLSPGELKLIRPSTIQDFSVLSPAGGYVNDNVLHNPGFRIAQRGTGPFTSATTPANNDDTYLVDQCILLSDGNDIVDVSRITDTAFTSGFALRSDVETANKKFGYLFPVENKDIQAIRSLGRASLQFKIRRTGTSIANVRAYLLSWNGTADAITSDVISAWNGSGANPSFATNWTAENTGSNLAVSTTVTLHELPNIVVDTSSITNLAVLIVVDDTDATVGDFLDIGDVKLEPGTVCTTHIDRPVAEDLARCLRYLYVLRASECISGNLLVSNTYNYTTTNARGVLNLPVPMRIGPQVSVTTIGNWYIQYGTANATASVLSVIGGFNQALWISVAMSASTLGYGGVFGTSTSTEMLTVTAEL